VPLIRFGRVIGVMDLDSPKPGRFDEEDARGLEALADVFLNAADVGD
jgi:GAF domain-containing protein